MTHLELLLKYKTQKAKFIAEQIKKHPEKFQRKVKNIELEKLLIATDYGQEGYPWAVPVTYNLIDDRPHNEYLYFGIRMEAETIKRYVQGVNLRLQSGEEIMLKDAILATYPAVKYKI